MDHIVHGDKGSHVLAAAICVIVIQVVAVALRFWSRALSRGTRFWWDDWMVLAALVRHDVFFINEILQKLTLRFHEALLAGGMRH